MCTNIEECIPCVCRCLGRPEWDTGFSDVSDGNWTWALFSPSATLHLAVSTLEVENSTEISTSTITIICAWDRVPHSSGWPQECRITLNFWSPHLHPLRVYELLGIKPKALGIISKHYTVWSVFQPQVISILLVWVLWDHALLRIPGVHPMQTAGCTGLCIPFHFSLVFHCII